MPKTPDDMTKFAEAHEKDKAFRDLTEEQKKDAQIIRGEQTKAQLEAMRLEYAERMGIDPSEVMIVACDRGQR